MGEYYTEQLVRQKTTLSTMMKKWAVVVFCILTFIASRFFIAVFPVFIASLVLVVYMWRYLNLEYEYLYFNGDLDIDRIMGKQRRKRVFEASIKTMDVIAPTGSIELQQYKSLKSYDCSSNTGSKTYEMVFTKKGEKVRVIFEPNDEILKNMKMLEPRKVFL